MKTSFENRVKGVEDDVSSRDGNIRSYIETNYSSKTQTSNLIESRVSSINTRLGNAESSLRQTANELSNKVSKNGIISQINQSSESVRIQASKINLDGDVTLVGSFESKDYGSKTKNSISMKSGVLSFYQYYQNEDVVGRIEANIFDEGYDSTRTLNIWAEKDKYITISNNRNPNTYEYYIFCYTLNNKKYVGLRDEVYTTNFSCVNLDASRVKLSDGWVINTDEESIIFENINKGTKFKIDANGQIH